MNPSFNQHTHHLCPETLSPTPIHPSLHLFIHFVGLSRFLPEVQLVLVGLWNSSERVEVREQLDTVVRLDVMHPVTEHL